MHVRRSSRSTFNIEQVSIPVQSTSAFPCAGQHSDTDHTSSASMLLPPITLLGKHQAGQHLISNRLAFFVEYVSISLCRSAFDHTLKCFNVTTANYPPRKTSSRSAFDFEQVSILCRIREHFIVQVSIRSYLKYRQLPSSENIKQVSI